MLTVILPVGVTRRFAVNHDIFARKVMLLPMAVRAGDCEPAVVMMTAAVTLVDEEITLIQSWDVEHIVWLGFDVNPGAVCKSGVREPVQLVRSKSVECELLNQLSSSVEDNPCL